VYEDAIRK